MEFNILLLQNRIIFVVDIFKLGIFLRESKLYIFNLKLFSC